MQVFKLVCFEPTHLINISQMGSFPQVGWKITNIWNHHLVLDKGGDFKNMFLCTQESNHSPENGFMEPKKYDLRFVEVMENIPCSSSENMTTRCL